MYLYKLTLACKIHEKKTVPSKKVVDSSQIHEVWGISSVSRVLAW